MLYGIAKCYVIFIVAVSSCLFLSPCATCLILSSSVSNDNLLIAFRVSPGTECQKSNYVVCYDSGHHVGFRCIVYTHYIMQKTSHAGYLLSKQ